MCGDGPGAAGDNAGMKHTPNTPSARELRAESVRLMRQAVELEIRARERDAAQSARNHPATACSHLKLVSEAQS